MQCHLGVLDVSVGCLACCNAERIIKECDVPSLPVQLPASLGLPAFAIPEKALHSVAQLLPSISSLPNLVLPQHLPEVCTDSFSILLY